MNYQNPFRKSVIALAVSSATALAGGFSGAAFAQEEAESLDEIVVTGSRIKRADLSAVSPVSVVGSEEFLLSGNLNVEQKLAELPQTLPSFGPSSNNPGDGTARVDLRGLGSFRTLVLVNGRRYIPATQTGVVDLNSIPGTLIKQVDVTTGGASAVYGSDALAGVVNFQLIDDFEGAEITALYDVASEGDAEKFNLDFTIGGNFDEGRGNAVVYTSYSKREALLAGERDFSSVALTENNGMLTPGGSAGIPGTLVVGTGIPGANVAAFQPGGDARAFQDPADRFNYAPDNFLQLPQERFLISSLAHYDLNDKARLYTELTFTNNEVDQELAPTPAFLSTVAINPDSPFFSPTVQSGLNSIRTDTNGDGVVNGNDNATLGFLGRRLVENGSRQVLDTRNGSRIVLGLKGDLNDSWSYDGFYSRSNLERTSLQNNDASDSRFRQALLVTDDGSACQDPSNGCVPLNIFGAGSITPAARDFINVGATNFTQVRQQVAQFSVSGVLGTLPSASESMGLVVGAEYRKEESIFRPDSFLSTGDVLGFNAGQPTEGSYDVTELFAEFSAPLIADRPGVEKLDFWGAYRYSDYSNIGGVSSFATALTWAPISKASLRIGYQEAVRAPNVSELFSGSFNGFPPATDPCSAGGFQPGVTDVALCEATGVPAGQVGVFGQTNTQIEGRFGGNANLDEESSDTFTVGLVVQPTDNLDITLDYFSIEIDDAISVLGGGVNNVLDICFNQIQDISAPVCQAVTRRGDGNVNFVTAGNENIGAIETSGVDLGLNYSKELGFGIGSEGSTFSVDLRGTYLIDYDVTPVVGLDTVNECAGVFGSTCDNSVRNDLVVTTRMTLETGDWTFSGLVRYLSSAEDENLVLGDGVARSTLVVPEVSSEVYLDLNAAYRFSDDFSVNFGVNNVLDTEPTALGDAAEQVNTFPSTYDLLGPRVFASARYRFR